MTAPNPSKTDTKPEVKPEVKPEAELQQERGHDVPANAVYPDAGVGTFDQVIEPDLPVQGTTILGVTIATEMAVMRSYGEETLLVNEDSVDMTRFTPSIPLLKGHDSFGQEYGHVKNPRIVDNKLKADIEFDEDYPEAMDIFNSIVIKKKPKHLSIGYTSDNYKVERLGNTLAESRVVSKWTIIDLSCVGAGEDYGAGFYRAATAPTIAKQESAEKKEISDMGNLTLVNMEKPTIMAEETKTTKINEAEVAAAALKQERAAIAAKMALCDQHGVDATERDKYIREGVPINDIKDAILGNISKRAASAPKILHHETPAQDPANKYREGNVEISMRGCLGALIASRDKNFQLDKESGLARDISQDLARSNTQPNGTIQMPFDALQTRASSAFQTRAIQATGTAGANTGAPMISDIVREDKLKEFLFANTVSGKLVTDVLTNVVENQSIPRIKTVGSAQVPGEGNPTALQQLTTDNLTLIAKPIIGAYNITKLAQAQIPTSMSRLERILRKQLQVAIDRLTLIGGGTNEPVGIMATTGVSTDRAGNASANTRNMGITEVEDLLEAIRTANVMGDASILAHPKILYAWKKLRTNGGIPLWARNTDMPNQGPFPEYLGEAKVYPTTNMRQNGDAAGDQRVLVGAFDEAITQAFFGNSFSLSFGNVNDDQLRDQVTVTMTAYFDVAVGYPQAFKGFAKVRNGVADKPGG